MKGPILKHFDCNKFSDNCQKARTFNALFTSAFTKKTHTIPEFLTSSEDTIYSIPFTVDKVNSKLKALNPYKYERVERQHPRTLKEHKKSYQQHYQLFSLNSLLKVSCYKIRKMLW